MKKLSYVFYLVLAYIGYLSALPFTIMDMLLYTLFYGFDDGWKDNYETTFSKIIYELVMLNAR